MKTLFAVLLVALVGCAPQIQEIVKMNDELARAYQDQKELASQLQDKQQSAIKELDISNAYIKELLSELDRLNNQGIKTVTVPKVETRVVKEVVTKEVPVTVPDGSMTSAEEAKQYNDLLTVQATLEEQRARATSLQQQIEAAQVVIGSLNDPVDRYGWPGLIGAVMTILSFIVGRKWKKSA